MHRDNIAQADSEVFANNLVHADFALFAKFVRKDDAYSVFPLLALDQHFLAHADLAEVVHLLKIQRHDAVVVVNSLICEVNVRFQSQVNHNGFARDPCLRRHGEM